MDSYTWQTHEFQHHYKTPMWTLGLAVIAALLFIFAVWSHSYMFAVLVPIMAFLLHHYAHKEPPVRTFTIDGLGVTIDQRHYPHESFSSFWIFYDPPHVKELSLRSKQRFLPYIQLPLGNEDPVVIRRMLMSYVPERRHRQSVVDDLARQLKF